MKPKARVLAIFISIAVAVGVFAAPTSAIGHCDGGAVNCYKSFQSDAGTRWNGLIRIKAAHNDSGRHAKQAYIRFTRAAGPALDTGRLYTPTAASPSETIFRSRTTAVWDSPLWGDQYTTKFNYGFFWF
ncbi:hypothetical protein [Cellulosimicrobium marinum]|uniref:hypothetical protein n=1 Tax=Cellulosimicrobium marinum TaxID=1638992 RepID=UPI001E2ACE4C|nr:hypothetical protein [Cellulosimicrobium marinum]MCB7138258.1 hypothetical protein [Cellulosimicrobium marinum]